MTVYFTTACPFGFCLPSKLMNAQRMDKQSLLSHGKQFVRAAVEQGIKSFLFHLVANYTQISLEMLVKFLRWLVCSS